MLIRVYAERAVAHQNPSCNENVVGAELVVQWVLEPAFLYGRAGVGGGWVNMEELYVQQA